MNAHLIIDSLQPEDRLILSCLQQQKSILKINIDEELLIHRLNYHHVSCIVYQHLMNINSLEIFSPQTQTKLKEHYYLNISRNLIISHLIKKVSSILSKNNIEVITLKGGMFIELFSNYALVREMSDLDIMVKSTELDKALDVLFASGFKDCENAIEKPSWYSRIYENAITLYSSQPGTSDIVIELHWQLFGQILNNTYWSEQDLWERAKYCSDKNIYYLDPIDVLLHLCAHQCNNLNIYLYGLVDIAQVLNTWSAQIDWLEVFYRAKSQRLLLHLVNMLRLVNELLNIPFPQEYFALFQFYEQQAEPGYKLLLERLFLKEATESNYVSLSIVKVFRRLEYSNFWQLLWYGYIKLFIFSLGRFFKLGSLIRSFSYYRSRVSK